MPEQHPNVDAIFQTIGRLASNDNPGWQTLHRPKAPTMISSSQ